MRFQLAVTIPLQYVFRRMSVHFVCVDKTCVVIQTSRKEVQHLKIRTAEGLSSSLKVCRFRLVGFLYHAVLKPVLLKDVGFRHPVVSSPEFYYC